MGLDACDPNQVGAYLIPDHSDPTGWATADVDAEMERLLPLVMERRDLPGLPSKAAHDGLLLLAGLKKDAVAAEHIKAACAGLIAAQLVAAPPSKSRPTLERFVAGIRPDATGFTIPYQTVLDLTRNLPASLGLRYADVVDGRVLLAHETLQRILTACLARMVVAPIVKAAVPVVEVFPQASAQWAALLRQRAWRKNEEQTIGIHVERLPPCIQRMLHKVENGEPVGHDERFNVAAFLTHFGVERNDILGIFSKSRGFDGAKSAYQIDHIRQRRYRPMSCGKLRDLGLCPDAACGGPTPILNYVDRMRAQRR